MARNLRPCVYILTSKRGGTLYVGVTADLIQREKRLKDWPRAYKIALIEDSNPEWRDLYPALAGLE